MGIKGLRKFLKRYAPTSVKDLHDIRGTRAAVDAMVFIYAAKRSGRELQSFFINMVATLDREDVVATFVFDGRARKEMKRHEHEKRRADRKRIECKIKELKEIVAVTPSVDVQADIKRLETSILRPTREEIENIKALLVKRGSKVITADGDGEHGCATLVRQGLCDYVISEDLDTLCFGAPLITGWPRRPQYLCLDTALTELGLSQEQFCQLCILLGSDLCANKIYGIGPVRAYRFMKDCGSIPRILTTHTDYTPPDHFPWREAVDVMMSLDPSCCSC